MYELSSVKEILKLAKNINVDLKLALGLMKRMNDNSNRSLCLVAFVFKVL